MLCGQRVEITSLSAGICVVKIILFSCEPEVYSLDGKYLLCIYVCIFGEREGVLVVDKMGMNIHL